MQPWSRREWEWKRLHLCFIIDRGQREIDVNVFPPCHLLLTLRPSWGPIGNRQLPNAKCQMRTPGPMSLSLSWLCPCVLSILLHQLWQPVAGGGVQESFAPLHLHLLLPCQRVTLTRALEQQRDRLYLVHPVTISHPSLIDSLPITHWLECRFVRQLLLLLLRVVSRDILSLAELLTLYSCRVKVSACSLLEVGRGKRHLSSWALENLSIRASGIC